jgi:hypothetical protein
MSLIAFEITKFEILLVDEEEDSAVALTMAQWQTLVTYFQTHPLDSHGWANHIRDDGSLTGMHPCPCHNIDNGSIGGGKT